MKRTAFFLIAALLALFSACSKDSSSDGIGGNSGANNTNDRAVTGAVLGTGMTYADVKGYVNITDELSAAAAANGLVFRVGVWYGENKNSLNRREVVCRRAPRGLPAVLRPDKRIRGSWPQLPLGSHQLQSFIAMGDGY